MPQRLEALTAHATRLAADLDFGPALPVEVTDDAPSSTDLRAQALGLREHLRSGGKMSRRLGPHPAPVRAAAGLLDHVTVGGSRVDTVAETDTVIAWLDRRIALAKARNWAAQHALPTPERDADMQGWLAAIGALPGRAAAIEARIDELGAACHVPTDAGVDDTALFVRATSTAAHRQLQDDLADYLAVAPPGAIPDLRLDGRPIQDAEDARTALRHVDAIADRDAVATALPAAWTTGRDLHDVGGGDPLAALCEVAAAVASLPGPFRPQTLSHATIGEVVDRAVADRQRAEIMESHRQFLAGLGALVDACCPASPATQRLREALTAEDVAAFRDASRQLEDERNRAKRASRLVDASNRLSDAHPTLVASFDSSDPDAAAVLRDLGRFQDLRAYARAVRDLQADYPDIRRLHDELSAARREAQRVEAELAAERCWNRAAGRLAADRRLASALSNLQKAERAVPKTRTAKSYQRKLRAMRHATRAAAPAIPCWVMPIDKVGELIGYPDRADRFDVVIVDEASQAWFPAAFLYAMADQVVVVGDHLQTSPAETTMTEAAMSRLARQHIPDHRLRDQLDGEYSLYDIARSITSPTVMVDHFRCVPPIIELSNRLCYAESGQRLLPVRTREPDGLEPIELVHVPDAQRTSHGGPNVEEIDAVVHHVANCATDAAYDGKTFGVIVVGPKPHAHTKELHSRLLETLGADEMAARQIAVGSPAQYQGSERDIVFLSLVAEADESGMVRQWPHELSGRNLRNVQKLNVAVSRARDQLWVFHSFTAAQLRPGDARHVLLDPPASAREQTLESQIARCQSDFERHVVTALAAHPAVARIDTQVEALGFFIDVVINDETGRRLAVECDGDPWHTAEDDIARDLYRQRTLESVGWRFHRFLSSEWYADPDRVLEATVAELTNQPATCPSTVNLADRKADATPRYNEWLASWPDRRTA
jgi:very-short-patch-repair endonuclease